MTKTQKTQKTKITELLANGKELTCRQAESRYKIKNLRARISELREDGWRINSNTTVNREGNRVVKYSLV